MFNTIIVVHGNWELNDISQLYGLILFFCFFNFCNTIYKEEKQDLFWYLQRFYVDNIENKNVYRNGIANLNLFSFHIKERI